MSASRYTTATRRVTFEAAHRLPEHDGGCRRLHGHSYAVEVTVGGPLHQDGPQHGMVLDFSRIDLALGRIMGDWDHRTMLWTLDPLADAIGAIDPGSLILVDAPPTAEFMAGLIGSRLLGQLEGVAVLEVRVQETVRGWAIWRP